MVVGNVTQSYEVIYNDNSNRVDGMILPNNSGVSSAISYFYDAFDRVTKKITIVSGTNASANIQESFTYKANSSLVAGQTVVINGGAATTYSYTYDAMGNILTVKKNGATVYTYCYNATNQLASVADAAAGYTYLYSYDSAGNIAAEYVFNYTTASAPLLGGMLGSAIDANVYTYSSADWQDKLTNYNGKSITYDAAGNPTKWRNASSITWDGRNLATYYLGSSSVGVQNTYNSSGIRTKKYYFDTVNNKAYNVNYVVDGSRIISASHINVSPAANVYTLTFIYDEKGNVVGFTNRNEYYIYQKNIQGDIVGIIDKNGNVVVEYTYDSWGKILSTTGSLASTIGEYNPFRYRSYCYDTETGLYYVSSRYYDPEIGRWISPEPNVYAGAFDSGSGLVGYNVYAYCANNPVNFSDPTGEFILTALIVGVVAGAVIGGAIGGTVAYNSAKSSGLEDSDLFWATAGGVGKGALIGGVAGGLIGATGGVVAAYGATSVAGTAMITATATITAKATEVTSLQAKKSTNDGDNGWQIANDCIDSVFSNGGKIISPALTKAGTTSATYVATDLIKHKVVPLGFDTFLHSTGGKVLPYGSALLAWGYTGYAIFCSDPISVANQRGYGLR